MSSKLSDTPKYRWPFTRFGESCNYTLALFDYKMLALPGVQDASQGDNDYVDWDPLFLPDSNGQSQNEAGQPKVLLMIIILTKFS